MDLRISNEIYELILERKLSREDISVLLTLNQMSRATLEELEVLLVSLEEDEEWIKDSINRLIKEDLVFFRTEDEELYYYSIDSTPIPEHTEIAKEIDEIVPEDGILVLKNLLQGDSKEKNLLGEVILYLTILEGYGKNPYVKN